MEEIRQAQEQDGNTQRHAIKGQELHDAETWRAKTVTIGRKKVFHVAENGRRDYRLCMYMQGMTSGESKERESTWTFATNTDSN